MNIPIAVIILVSVVAIMHFVPTRRRRELREVISDLEVLKLDPTYKMAAERNIRFFKASRSVFTFVHWLVFVAPKLRKERESLLELGDLPLEKWQRRTYQALTKFGSNSFGRKIFLTGFVKELSKIILKIQGSKINNEATVMLELGFGGGELVRQVFKKLPDVPLVYIGIDLSPASIRTARREFKPLHNNGEIIFKELPMLSDEIIDTLRREAIDTSKKVVATWCGNILELDKYLSTGKVDLISHARVFHHLTSAGKARLVNICQKLSPTTVELDDRYSSLFTFWSVLGAWIIYPNVALLNGGILSCLRDPAKEELTGYFKLVPPFSYVRLIFGQNTHRQDGDWETTRATFAEGFSFRD